jgi:adenylyl cyclase-associated protein
VLILYIVDYSVHISLRYKKNGRWVVENQVGKKNLAIDDCDARQSVYVYGCKDSVLQVNGNIHLYLGYVTYYISRSPILFGVITIIKHFAGKVNNITVDKCTKVGIVFKVSGLV